MQIIEQRVDRLSVGERRQNAAEAMGWYAMGNKIEPIGVRSIDDAAR